MINIIINPYIIYLACVFCRRTIRHGIMAHYDDPSSVDEHGQNSIHNTLANIQTTETDKKTVAGDEKF